MTRGAPLLGATVALREALEESAVALAAADDSRLLRAELALQLALERLTSRPLPEPADRDLVRREVERAGLVLARCRRLGANLVALVQITLDAQGRAPDYGRRSPAVEAPRLGLTAHG